MYMNKTLFSPIRIGKMAVKNRMVMAPMNTNFSNENGAVTEQMISYFEQRAKNEVGLIVVEAASVVESLINHAVQPLMTHDKFVPGWWELVDRLHGYDAKVSIELAYYGSEAEIGELRSASDISHYSRPVRPLTVDEIHEIENRFVDAAIRAKTAGFDAITLHAAHGYGLAQFLTPLYNKRTDEYGGSLENRMQMLTEIIYKCRQALGKNYPIMVRYSINEYCEGGRDLEEAVAIAKLLEAAGVNAIDLSSGIPASGLFNVRPSGLANEEGFLSTWSKQIKAAVSIPVICAGMLRNPDMMNKHIEDGCMDLVALGRVLLADEAFCLKAVRGENNRIRRCLGCQECFATLNKGMSVRCTVNPKLGRDHMFKDSAGSHTTPMRILVVGTGPSGLSAALSLQNAGHQVVLADKADKLGGTMLAAAIPPGKQSISELINWYANELQIAGVELRLSCEFNEQLVQMVQPYRIVFATGAKYSRIIAGSDRYDVLTATEALLHPERVGNRVVIIGGGASGAEIAEYFCDEAVKVAFDGVDSAKDRKLLYHTRKRKDAKPRQVNIIEMQDRICADMYEESAEVLRIKLHENGVKVYTTTGVQRIEENKVWLKNLQSGEEFSITVDTVILAAGLQPNHISPHFCNDNIVYYLADCQQPGKIRDAIYAGTMMAKRIK